MASCALLLRGTLNANKSSVNTFAELVWLCSGWNHITKDTGLTRFNSQSNHHYSKSGGFSQLRGEYSVDIVLFCSFFHFEGWAEVVWGRRKRYWGTDRELRRGLVPGVLSR